METTVTPNETVEGISCLNNYSVCVCVCVHVYVCVCVCVSSVSGPRQQLGLGGEQLLVQRREQ